MEIKQLMMYHVIMKHPNVKAINERLTLANSFDWSDSQGWMLWFCYELSDGRLTHGVLTEKRLNETVYNTIKERIHVHVDAAPEIPKETQLEKSVKEDQEENKKLRNMITVALQGLVHDSK